MTVTPGGGLVTPTRPTLSFGKLTVAPEGKTESPGEKAMTPVGHPSVTPGDMSVPPVPIQTGDRITPPRRQAVAPEKMTLPSGKRSD